MAMRKGTRRQELTRIRTLLDDHSDELTTDELEVVVLHASFAKPLCVVARFLGCSASTVGRRFRKAKEKLEAAEKQDQAKAKPAGK